MSFLRHNTLMVWAFAAMFVAQIFVPMAVASTQGDHGIEGIVICTASGLKQLTPEGDLIPVGDNSNNHSAPSECLVCFTAALNDFCTVPKSVTSDLLRPGAVNNLAVRLHLSIPSGHIRSDFKARAPPVTA